MIRLSNGAPAVGLDRVRAGARAGRPKWTAKLKAYVNLDLREETPEQALNISGLAPDRTAARATVALAVIPHRVVRGGLLRS